MSGRTRLDEIVDEEMRAWGTKISFGTGPTMMGFTRRIAERVYRLGVEDQARLTGNNPTAQPAPAEEKPKPCSKCGHAHMHGAFCGLPCECDRSKEARIRYDRNYIAGPLVTNERRKGERRSGCEWKSFPGINAAQSTYTRHLAHDGVTWYRGPMLDLRSGKDRRK